MLSMPCHVINSGCKGVGMSNNNMALSFDTAEYYSLQEASEYLNRKYKTENITPKKLLKIISSGNIDTFIHFRIDSFSSNLLRVHIENYESNVFPKDKDIYSLDEEYVKPLVNILNSLEKLVSDSLIEDLYMGFILFRIDENSLFNMSLNNNPQKESFVFSFDGFINKFSNDDDPSKPNQLRNWGLDLEDTEYYLTNIGGINFVIDSINDDDLNEYKEKMPFSCSFEKRKDFSFIKPEININDLIILHKDVVVIEEKISEDHPTILHNQFKSRKGISDKKALAKAVAKKIATDYWEADSEKQKVKIGEMCEIVWSKLVDFGFRTDLPGYPKNLKPWIKDVAPKYASESGRPRS